MPRNNPESLSRLAAVKYVLLRMQEARKISQGILGYLEGRLQIDFR